MVLELAMALSACIANNDKPSADTQTRSNSAAHRHATQTLYRHGRIKYLILELDVFGRALVQGMLRTTGSVFNVVTAT